MNKKILSVVLGAVIMLSQMNFVMAGEPNKEKIPGPVISLDTSQFEQYGDEDVEDIFYELEGKMQKMTGTIETHLEIVKLQYTINIGHWTLITKDLTPSKKFTLEKLPMFEYINTLTIMATDSENNTGTYSMDIYNSSEENRNGLVVDEKDNDKDGLLNFEELYYGTDLNKVDTDGDGLTDSEELELTGTDTLKPDTDDNGILDGDEDFDEDGLTNLKEIKLNADPYEEDTDWDGLTDGEEAALGTKLDGEDTDEDGLTDGQEVQLGTNPLKSDTNGNGILDGDEKYIITLVNEYAEPGDVITPKLSLKVIGNEIYWYEIEPVWDEGFYLTKYIPGYIDEVYEFSGENAFEDALLSFEYKGTVPISSKFKPAIYFLNDETESLEKVPGQSRNGKMIQAQISAFGRYMVLNEVIFDATTGALLSTAMAPSH